MDTVGIAEAIDGMLEETVGWGLVLGFQNVQVIKDLFLVKIQRTTFEMKGYVGQTTCIIGKGALALARELDGTP